MIRNATALALLAAALTACEQTSQQLTLPGSGAEPVTRAVPATGGSVNSAAGASLQLPSGALGGPVTVTLTPEPVSAPLGVAASAHSFRIEPAGTALQVPATIELKLTATGGAAWLTIPLLRAGEELHALDDAHVDLALGTVRAPLPRFGTVTAVVPPPHAVVYPTRLSAEPTAGAARPSYAAAAVPQRIDARCDVLAGGCERTPDFAISATLHDMVDELAVVMPRFDVRLQVGEPFAVGGETRHRISGGGELVATVRARAGRVATSTGIMVVIAADWASSLSVVDGVHRLHAMYVGVHQCGHSSTRSARCELKVEARRDVVLRPGPGGPAMVVEFDGIAMNNQSGGLRVELPAILQ